MEKTEDLKKQLNKALNECARLKAENDRLRQMLGQIPIAEPSIPSSTVAEPNLPFTPTASKIINDSPSKDKIALFRSLFRGREDVYPVRWERKDGRSGYSPACVLEWKRPLCGKPAVKCGDCRHRNSCRSRMKSSITILSESTPSGCTPCFRMKPAGFWPSISTGRPGRRTPGPSWPPATKWPYPRPWKGPAPGKGDMSGCSSKVRFRLLWLENWAARS